MSGYKSGTCPLIFLRGVKLIFTQGPQTAQFDLMWAGSLKRKEGRKGGRKRRKDKEKEERTGGRKERIKVRKEDRQGKVGKEDGERKDRRMGGRKE